MPAKTSSAGASSSTQLNTPPTHCVPAEQVFMAIIAFSSFLVVNLDNTELLTLINILSAITTNLSSYVTQSELCKGVVIQPTE